MTPGAQVLPAIAAALPTAAGPEILEAVERLVTRAYEAVTDACDEGYVPEYDTAGRPLAQALELLREALP